MRDPSQVGASGGWAARPLPARNLNQAPIVKKETKSLPSQSPQPVFRSQQQTKPVAAKNSGTTNLKPEQREWKPLGVIDFSKGDVLRRGISNTKNFRYGLDKQLKGVFEKSSQREKVIQKLTGKITSSGISKMAAKHALWDLKAEGHITSGQMSRLSRHLGM